MSKFKPGQSGNPGGRPKFDGGVRELAQRNCPKAIQTLVKLMDSKDERVAMAASEAVLNRGLGKPAQSIEVTGDMTHRTAPQLSDELLADIAAGSGDGASGAAEGPQEPPAVH